MYGEQFMVALKLAAFASGIGVEFGSGEPNLLSPLEQDSSAIHGSKRIVYPSVRGLSVYPEAENSGFRISEIVSARITTKPEPFLEALACFSEQMPIKLERSALGVRVMLTALEAREPLAKIVLAFSAVEALGQEEGWSKDQCDAFTRLIDHLNNIEITKKEKNEMIDAINRNLYRVSLRQSVFRELKKLGIEGIKRRWDELYGLRSALFHGTRTFSPSELSKLSRDSIAMCGYVVAKLLEADNIVVPNAVKHKYNPL